MITSSKIQTQIDKIYETLFATYMYPMVSAVFCRYAKTFFQVLKMQSECASCVHVQENPEYFRYEIVNKYWTSYIAWKTCYFKLLCKEYSNHASQIVDIV